MADIFDTIAPEASGDIFDQLAPDPEPDIFDQIAPEKDPDALKSADSAFSQSATRGIGNLLKGTAVLAQGTAGLSLYDPEAPPALNREMARQAAAHRALTPAQSRQSLETDPLFVGGSALEQVAPEVHPVPESRKNNALTRVASAAGGFVPLVASGPMAPATIGLQSAGEHITADYEASKAAGLDDNQAAEQAITKAMQSGALQATIFAALPTPVRSIAKKYIVNKLGQSALTRWLSGRASAGGEGAILGASSQAAENAVENKPLTEGAGDSATALGLMNLMLPWLRDKGGNSETPPNDFSPAKTPIKPQIPGNSEKPIPVTSDLVSELKAALEAQQLKQPEKRPEVPAIPAEEDTLDMTHSEGTHYTDDPSWVEKVKSERDKIEQRAQELTNSPGSQFDEYDREDPTYDELAQALAAGHAEDFIENAAFGHLDLSGNIGDEQSVDGPPGPGHDVLAEARLKANHLRQLAGLKLIPPLTSETYSTPSGVVKPRETPPENGIANTLPTSEGLPEPAAGVKPEGDVFDRIAPEKEKPAEPASDELNQSVQSETAGSPTETQAPRVGKGLRARKIFDRETEMNGPDLLSWLTESGGLLSKSQALKQWGPEKFNQNKSLWDDAPKMTRPHHNIIYGGRRTPDEAAQRAYEDGLISAPDVNEFWAELQKASNARSHAYETKRRDEAQILAEEDWHKATTSGKVPVHVDDLKVGDAMEIDGEHVKVTQLDPDSGEVTLEDGSRFGRQKLESGKTIYVENIEEQGGGQWEAAGASAELPKLRQGEKGTSELFQGEDQPFNLAGEKGTDFERVAKEKAKAEQTKREAREIEAKRQMELAPTAQPKEVAPITKVESSASRFRPREKIQFEKPLTGPSGSKLVAYEWKWQPEEYIDKYGEERVKRVSDWDEAEQSAATGRDLVHQFIVEMPDGDQRLVSSESVLHLLGYTEKTQSGSARSLISTAKTLAKLKMQLAATEGKLAENQRIMREVSKLTPPEITGGGPAFENQKSDSRATRWSMGDVYQVSHDGLTPYVRERLAEYWRTARAKEMGLLSVPESTFDLKRRISRAEEKLKGSNTPSIGTGMRRAVEGNKEAGFIRLPDHIEKLVEDLTPKAREVFDWSKGVVKFLNAKRKSLPNRDFISVKKDWADNAATIFGNKAGNSVLHEMNRAFGAKTLKEVEARNGLREDALTFIIETGISTEQGQNRSLDDFRQKIRDSEASQTVWGKRALKAIDYAEQHWDKLKPISDQYAQMTDLQNRLENAMGYTTLYRKGGYVFHLQDINDKHEFDTASASGQGGAPAPFRHIRDYDTYADAIAAGVKPRTLNAVDLLNKRMSLGQRMVNYGSWIDLMKDKVDPTTGTPLVVPPVVRLRANGTEDITAPPGYQLIHFGGQQVALHNGYAGLFSALTKSSIVRDSAFWTGVVKAASASKHFTLLFDSYHMGRLAFWNAVTRLGAPKYKRGQIMLDNTLADVREMVANGEVPEEWGANLLESKRRLDLMVSQGLNVGNVGDNLYTDWVQKIPGIGTFNDWLFRQYQRGAMGEVGLIEFARQQKMFPDLPEDVLARKVAKQINIRFGNLQSQSWLKSKTFQDLARMVFLAPQWNESLIRAELGAVRDLGLSPMQSLKSGKFAMGALGRAAGLAALGTFFANQLINYGTRGHPTWENPEEDEGAKLSAWIPDYIGGGPGFFLNPMALPAEISHLLMKSAGRNGGNYLDAIKEYLRGRLNTIGKPAYTFLTHEDSMGKKARTGMETADMMFKGAIPAPISGSAIYRAGKQLVSGENEEQFPGQFQRQLMQSGGVKTDSAPNPEQRIRRLAKDFNAEKGIIPSAEFYTSDYQPLSEALRRGNMTDARQALADLLQKKTRDQIKKHYQDWTKHPFTGKKEREREFWSSLDAEQREKYKEAQASRAELSKQALKLLANPSTE